MRKLVVVALLALTFSVTACGSEKESVKTEASSKAQKVENKEEKKDSKKDSKIVAKVESAESAVVESDSSGEEIKSDVKEEKSDKTSENVGQRSAHAQSQSSQQTSQSQPAQTAQPTQPQSQPTQTTQPSQPQSQPAQTTQPTQSSQPSNGLGDLEDDAIDPAPEQPQERTLETILAECGVTNYKIINGGTDFIDYDGYTIMIDGVQHNIWKGVDYGASAPYSIWGGGCGSFDRVPEGWSPSWTVAQVDAALGF